MGAGAEEVGVHTGPATTTRTACDYHKEGVYHVPFRLELLKQTDLTSEDPIVPLVPATYRYRYRIRPVHDDYQGFLKSELDISRLNAVHRWLWLCGLPSLPNSLHYQRPKKRDIVVSEQIDLHLVWTPARIFIKPLPRFLLSPGFWESHICPYPQIYEIALGFLYSYVGLIEREVDHKLAIELGLIPSEIKWSDWVAFVEDILESPWARSYFSGDGGTSTKKKSAARIPINKRFHYGELRLGRLNWIYRLWCLDPKGYMSGCTTYGAFVRENLNSLITLFAYTTIVLSAMQVGLSTHLLGDDYAFGMASYVFSVFAILAPLTALLVVLLVLAVLFIVNLIKTLKVRRQRIREGAGV
ncbi:hypothetical protein M011DRAFT_410778 [Sporormia fimetaria CBS 119925]|uniref:Uncharacterized protein n=1 Tax=Sporormia fimetaria CBS 119925 TaxID=1340428 RepID=A0A6A6UYT8_9PLEO|nr:hypothetical protein M011DRAFT_410778 [Sporormia fimetaria CBS 119925]